MEYTVQSMREEPKSQTDIVVIDRRVPIYQNNDLSGRDILTNANVCKHNTLTATPP